MDNETNSSSGDDEVAGSELQDLPTQDAVQPPAPPVVQPPPPAAIPPAVTPTESTPWGATASPAPALSLIHI